MKPRLHHVAELAGVSPATVSRVLNGRPGVAEPTRREVLRALSQLGYEPVGRARARHHGIVGLVVPELDNPVFPRLAQAIESRLAAEGRTMLMGTSTPAGMREADYLDALLDQAVAGIVIVSGLAANLSADHRQYEDLVARGVPTVLVNGRAPGIGLAAVSTDHVAAGQQAVRHLAELGHTRIGVAIGPLRYIPSREFLDGYHQGMASAALPLNDTLVSETLYGVEGGHAAGRDLIRLGATAVICASDPIALGVMRAARDSGLEITRDLSVIGFDDAGGNAHTTPPLTSTKQPFEDMAAGIVRLLRQQITEALITDTELRFQPELVVRASTGAVPERLPRPADSRTA